MASKWVWSGGVASFPDFDLEKLATSYVCSEKLNLLSSEFCTLLLLFPEIQMQYFLCAASDYQLRIYSHSPSLSPSPSPILIRMKSTFYN